MDFETHKLMEWRLLQDSLTSSNRLSMLLSPIEQVVHCPTFLDQQCRTMFHENFNKVKPDPIS